MNDKLIKLMSKLKNTEAYELKKYSDKDIDAFSEALNPPDNMLAIGNAVSGFNSVLKGLLFMTDDECVYDISALTHICEVIKKDLLSDKDYELFVNTGNNKDACFNINAKNGDVLKIVNTDKESPLKKYYKTNTVYCYLAETIGCKDYEDEYNLLKSHLYIPLLREYKSDDTDKLIEIATVMREMGCIDDKEVPVVSEKNSYQKVIFYQIFSVCEKVGFPDTKRKMLNVLRVVKRKLKGKHDTAYDVTTTIEGFILDRRKPRAAGNVRNNNKVAGFRNNLGVLIPEYRDCMKGYVWGFNFRNTQYVELEDNFIKNEIDECLESLFDEDSFDDSDEVNSVTNRGEGKFRANASTLQEYQMRTVNKMSKIAMLSNNISIHKDSLNIYDIAVYIKDSQDIINMRGTRGKYGLLMLLILFSGRNLYEFTRRGVSGKSKVKKIVIFREKKEIRIPVYFDEHKIYPDESSIDYVYKTKKTLRLKLPTLVIEALEKCKEMFADDEVNIDEYFTAETSKYRKIINNRLKVLNSEYGSDLTVYKIESYLKDVILNLPYGGEMKAVIITGKVTPKSSVSLIYHTSSEGQLRSTYKKACYSVIGEVNSERSAIDKATNIRSHE